MFCFVKNCFFKKIWFSSSVPLVFLFNIKSIRPFVSRLSILLNFCLLIFRFSLKIVFQLFIILFFPFQHFILSTFCLLTFNSFELLSFNITYFFKNWVSTFHPSSFCSSTFCPFDFLSVKLLSFRTVVFRHFVIDSYCYMIHTKLFTFVIGV